jgi:hypothetical protein
LALWPLALIPLVGGLLIGGAIWGASHLPFGPSPEAQQRAEEAALLDSMQADARAVTPAGLHEIALSHHGCDDSGTDFVERALRIDGEHRPGAVRTALLDAYVKRGWHRVAFAFAVSKDTVERAYGGRSLRAVESDDGHLLTVDVVDGTCWSGD